MARTAPPPYDLVVILGPTASGKTRIAVEVARALQGEIISADSRQVYRGMDIGTGKDLEEYGETPYHLIDILDPGAEFSVFDFQRRYLAALAAIHARGRLPILAGGTGMYLDAALREYRLREVPENPALRLELAALSLEGLAARLQKAQPRLHNTTDLLDRRRLVRAIEIAEAGPEQETASPLPHLCTAVFGIRWPRPTLRQRITHRLRTRLNNGLIEEARRLHEGGVSYETLYDYGLEYRFAARHLQGELNRNDLLQKLNSAIHQLAKRQETWFRRMERQGIRIHWVDGPNGAADILRRLRDREVAP